MKIPTLDLKWLVLNCERLKKNSILVAICCSSYNSNVVCCNRILPKSLSYCKLPLPNIVNLINFYSKIPILIDFYYSSSLFTCTIW